MKISAFVFAIVMMQGLLGWPVQHQNYSGTAAKTAIPAVSVRFTSSSSSSSNASEWFHNWDIETRIGQSQLILVVRVSNVSAVTVVQGAKVNTTHREYRFQPVRRLKGVFTRDELSMTSSDLGLTEGDGSQAPPIQPGEFRLLLLTRTVQGGFSCTGYQPGTAFNLEQIIPKLRGADDPIVGMAETLVRVTESPSRRERVELLVKQLDATAGPAAVPLTKSLAARAHWAAETPMAAGPLLRLAADDSTSIRAAALQTLERVLAVGSFGDDSKVLGEAAEAMRRLLESDDVETAVRVSALLGIGHLSEFGRRLPWTGPMLARSLEEPRTHAERVAAAAALADLNDPNTTDRLLSALTRLPLDEPPNREQILIAAAVRLAGNRTGPVLSRRLERKLAAEHYAAIEIAYLGQLKHHDAFPLLLRAAEVDAPYRQGQEAGCTIANVPGLGAYANWDAFHQQRMAVAYAFEQIKDSRAVHVLDGWLRDSNQYVRARAVDALDAIDSDEAVGSVRLRLKAEPDLQLKLRMAALLGRHQIADGYALAIEHAADPGLMEVAVRAIGAIRDPGTAAELWNILNTSHDPAWNAAALAGLVAVRDPKIKDRLFKILSDPRNPLLASAVTAAGELGDPDCLPLVAPLVGSRNDQVVYAALRTIVKLATPEKIGDDAERRKSLATAVSNVLALVADQDTNLQLRVAALDTAKTLADPRVHEVFTSLADQSALENTLLLERVEQQLRRAAARGVDPTPSALEEEIQ
jgi:HEAT repeat protein